MEVAIEIDAHKLIEEGGGVVIGIDVHKDVVFGIDVHKTAVAVIEEAVILGREAGQITERVVLQFHKRYSSCVRLMIDHLTAEYR